MYRRGDEFALRGFVAPGFEAVRAHLAQSLERGEECGVSVAVYHRGQLVVELAGGVRDAARQLPYTPSTLTLGFSSTKGVVALCFLMLRSQGLFDYDAPVASYWPEFGQAGKGTMSVRTLLNHRAGLVGLDAPLRLEELERDLEGVEARLAAQAPSWAPGESQGYHGVTYGLYAGALFRRIAGRSLGAFIASSIREPLGAEIYLGLPPEHESRVARIVPATTYERLFKFIPMALTDSTEGRVIRSVLSGADTARAFRHPAELGPRGVANFNARRTRALELPWVGAQMTARGLARMYAALAQGGSLDGVRLVSPELIPPLYERQSWSPRDRVLQKPLGWSQGFLKEEESVFSASPESFGHPGAGGALGWCDPPRELAIAYLPNRMAYHIRSPRARALARVIYQAAAKR
ncbi:MAG: beta-lactamase family protein [Polyangiaceae bacterium]|nr:beta-lactamase family protein [Polyangiaceae bacterium]MCW5792308.1 beta-lactamase family protein [Polyangiaceae bacterium]